MSAPTERDREMAREYYGPSATYDVVSMLADLLAQVRREGHAEALAAVRKQVPLGHWSAVDEAERVLKSGET